MLYTERLMNMIRLTCAVALATLLAATTASAQTFEVACAVPALGLTETGEGRSRRVAEQEAAHRMLQILKASDKPGSALRS